MEGDSKDPGSWLVTLPIGALLGAIAYLLVTSPVLNRAWG